MLIENTRVSSHRCWITRVIVNEARGPGEVSVSIGGAHVVVFEPIRVEG